MPVIRGYRYTDNDESELFECNSVFISGSDRNKDYFVDPFWQSLVSASAIKMLETCDKVEIEMNDEVLYTLSK